MRERERELDREKGGREGGREKERRRENMEELFVEIEHVVAGGGDGARVHTSINEASVHPLKKTC